MYKFTVEGRGSLPLDMLRYDNCWPSSAEDADRIMESILEDPMLIWVITLTSNQKPTPARWRSFNWRVRK